MRQRYEQPTSRVLALVVVVGNLLVCGAITTVLLVARDDGPPVAADAFTEEAPPVVTTSTDEWPDPTDEPTSSSTADRPSTSDEPCPGADFEQVVGPGGMTTCIPAGWPTKTATGPGAMQADDPTGAERILRYGGSPTTLTDSYDLHADYERQFSANKSNYVSIRLERTDVRGMSAVDWEFEYDAAAGRRHVRSVYWLASGYEFFVYASSPADSWFGTEHILDVMRTYSTP